MVTVLSMVEAAALNEVTAAMTCKSRSRTCNTCDCGYISVGGLDVVAGTMVGVAGLLAEERGGAEGVATNEEFLRKCIGDIRSRASSDLNDCSLRLSIEDIAEGIAGLEDANPPKREVLSAWPDGTSSSEASSQSGKDLRCIYYKRYVHL